VPEGSLYSKFCFSGLKLRNFMVAAGDRERKNIKFSGSRSQLLSRKNFLNLETLRRNPLLFIPEHFTVVKKFIVQLLLLLLLASFHRRQQLENKA